MDLRMENLPVNEKQPLFARALTPILYDPRLKADRRSKSKQSPRNSFEIDAILDCAAK